MRTQYNSKTTNLVSLNQTFFELANGATTLDEIVARHIVARAQIFWPPKTITCVGVVKRPNPLIFLP